MDEQQVLEQQLLRVEFEKHQLWERIRQLDAFLGESVAQMVNTCLAQKHALKKQQDQWAEKGDSIRLKLRTLVGPSYKCTCPEYTHTGECGHMERLNELMSREEV